MSESYRRRSFGHIGIALVIFAFCLSAAPAIAQVLYGSITGTVKDTQGATVPGATVTIVNKETNLTRETVTNAEGAYSLINVLPGPYDVKVSLHGVPRRRAHERAGHASARSRASTWRSRSAR